MFKRQDIPLYEIEARCLRATAKALLIAFFDDDHYRQLWVPRSVVDDDESDLDMPGDEGSILIHEWFAKQNGLV